MNQTDATAFPRPIAGLIAMMPLAPLGPGRPDQTARVLIEGLEDADFGAPVVDRRMADCCRAGLWLAFGFLDQSHEICQEIDTTEGSYWHALMHRREPDHANAAYWLGHVGAHPIHAPLREEGARLAVDAPTSGAFLARQRAWDAFAFNDLVEAHRDEAAPCNRLCRQVQRAEWELLFAWCFARAVGAA